MFRAVLILLCLASANWLFAKPAIQFNNDIRPILSNSCFHCHGPDEAERQADLRLDMPGDIDFDELITRITSPDSDVVMPPPESHKALTPAQVELLRRWIAEGAQYETHWAFKPLRTAQIPAVRNDNWSAHSIDRFVLSRLESKSIEPRERADKRTLIRRITFDLTGLPPTPEEIDAFLSDSSELAYETLVDRLLGSPRYGEHMARYWLDLVRFADTNGLHHDHYREMTPYRDWIIRSFNNNLPFDQFITDQIAGDLHPQPTVDQQIASGFNRLHLIIDQGTALPEESFVRNVTDRVTAFGTAFLGLTVQCAVCHDHKYDPISQKEFYQLYAFFNNFDGESETGWRRGSDFERGLQKPYIELPSPEQETRLADFDAKIKNLTTELEIARESKNSSIPESAELEDRDTEGIIQAVEEELKELRAKRKELLRSIPASLIMKERTEVRPAHILIRGIYDQPGELVERDTPAILPPMPAREGLRTRLDLAEWLTDGSHPLTSRVAVNRIWQQFFGVGLVRTSEDFGAQGEPPSHPELLDYLALSFMESGWDVKALVRSIVLSETYRQSSKAPRELFVDDPDNRLLARGSRFRLDAEVIRDQILAVSGLINEEHFGPSVKPPQPPGLWKIVAMPSSYPREYQPDKGDKIYRRSIYTFWRRSMPPPQMTILDAPTRESCIARRERTNTPLQALLLMNEEQYFRAAINFAESLLQSMEPTDEERIQLAYERITSQIPNPSEMSLMVNTLNQFRAIYRNDVSDAENMIATVSDNHSYSVDQKVELASWTMLVNSLLNLDITKTHQ